MYRKNKIPKGIVDKIKQRNKLNKEIEEEEYFRGMSLEEMAEKLKAGD